MGRYTHMYKTFFMMKNGERKRARDEKRARERKREKEK